MGLKGTMKCWILRSNAILSARRVGPEGSAGRRLFPWRPFGPVFPWRRQVQRRPIAPMAFLLAPIPHPPTSTRLSKQPKLWVLEWGEMGEKNARGEIAKPRKYADLRA